MKEQIIIGGEDFNVGDLPGSRVDYFAIRIGPDMFSCHLVYCTGVSVLSSDGLMEAMRTKGGRWFVAMDENLVT